MQNFSCVNKTIGNNFEKDMVKRHKVTRDISFFLALYLPHSNAITMHLSVSLSLIFEMFCKYIVRWLS